MGFPIRQLRASEYPELLREIPQPPKELFIRGSLPRKEYSLLCVVGSRATSAYGRRVCASLITGLARYPVAVVSGMALGIDSQAHTTALDVGLPTVAVLPSSCDDASLYPASGSPLAKRILARGGALMSERKGPWKAHPHDFIARNRIMAGMCRVVLIIEASEKSGTLITAKLALDYNREVLAVPHELGRETGAGANRLLREGATLVRSSEDILEALGISPSGPTQVALPADLTTVEAALLEALTEPCVRDDLIDAIEVSAQEANIALSSLLLRGLIVERLGKIERV